MIFLKYTKGDLFEDLEFKKEVILLHAVNSKKVWGSGIAKIFCKNFPLAYSQYKNNKNVLGTGYILEDNGYRIACLVTSVNYGKWIDPPLKIADSTYRAVKNLLEVIPDDSVIHSPKINVGLFKTPWNLTEDAIRAAGRESEKNVEWLVFEL